MEDSRFAFLFHRYVNNACTEEEEREFLGFIASSRHDVAVKTMMDQLWQEVPLKKLNDSRTVEIVNTILEADRQRDRLVTFSFFRKMAAVLLLGVAVSGALLYFIGYPGDDRLSDGSNYQEAKQTFIRLPDGSTVFLNKGSKLEYPASFEYRTIREVHLAGEGFFDIKHDPSKPFVVHTGKLNTTVLGTAFNVKAFSDDADITVTVTRGKVRVSDDTKVLGVILPNEQITFSKLSEKIYQEGVNARQAVSWLEKDISFDDITMADAAMQLEKRFDVKITFANDAIQGCRFTATFVNGETLDQILSIICVFNKVTFEYSASGVIEINGSGC